METPDHFPTFAFFFFSVEDIRGKIPSTYPHFEDGTRFAQPEALHVVARRHASNET
jgi:hypothetical protein